MEGVEYSADPCANALIANDKPTIARVALAEPGRPHLPGTRTRKDAANMKQHVPLLRDIRMLAGCGHWTQQERPAEVSAAIIEFLRGLPD